ncbi:MAG: TIGR01777 family oxidoreductase [Planctomycetota bacterium]|jgi:uncharacterized protein (TIGR01777 family)
MPDYCASALFEHPRNRVFRYHATPGAIDRLIPPWEPVRLARRSDSLETGSEVELVQRVFGIRKSWLARHTKLVENELFVDEQIHGPFARWVHRHEFEAVAPDACAMHDRIDFQLPLSPFSNIAEPWARGKLDAMFAFRHRITADDLNCQQQFEAQIRDLGHVPRIAVTGATGLLGRRVVELASVLGWHVIRIARPESKPEEIPFPRTVESVVWDARTSTPPSSLSDLDAVIHLAGFGIAEERWSDEVKKRIWSSRVDGTKRLSNGLAGLTDPPRRLVSASGIGVFGDRGDSVCSEETEPGRDFLPELAVAWEEAAQEFASSAHRVVQARLGVVLHPRVGALPKLLGPARWGMGGPLGSGQQYWPWVHIDDAANILLHLAIAKDISGPYHVIAPEQVRQREFATTLGRVLHRPAFFPTPAWLLRLAIGEMADPLLLASVRAVTPKLIASGYRFRFPELRGALENLLGLEKLAGR